MLRILPLFLIALSACGIGTHKRILTRPDTYDKSFSFPSTGDPVDINALVREYPELKGYVMSAPEYMEIYLQQVKQAELKGVPVIQYQFSRGSAFNIEVVGEPELSKGFVVNPDGYIYFPIPGRAEKIKVEGKTIEELRSYIEERLSETIKKPQVIVHVQTGGGSFKSSLESLFGPTQPTGEEIIMMGAVSSRAAYTGNETLVRLLGRTGLPSTAEWRNILVIKRDRIDPVRNKPKVVVCDMWAFLRLLDQKQDIPVFAGDIVYVPMRWSTGDQFNKDWGILLSYLGGLYTLDAFKDAIRKGGVFRD